MGEIQDIMTADESGKLLVEFAQRKGATLARDGLTRSQIRLIFTEVRQIEALWTVRQNEAMRRLNMLKPKMAYQTSRDTKVQGLKDILTEAITEVEKAQGEKRDNAFNRFMNLFEAILAYHRANGGK